MIAAAPATPAHSASAKCACHHHKAPYSHQSKQNHPCARESSLNLWLSINPEFQALIKLHLKDPKENSLINLSRCYAISLTCLKCWRNAKMTILTHAQSSGVYEKNWTRSRRKPTDPKVDKLLAEAVQRQLDSCLPVTRSSIEFMKV